MEIFIFLDTTCRERLIAWVSTIRREPTREEVLKSSRDQNESAYRSGVRGEESA